MTFYINIKSFDYKHEQEFDNLESAKLKILQTGFKTNRRIWQIFYVSLFKKLLKWQTAAAKSHQLCPTLRSHRRQPTRLPRPWDSPGKNTGVGSHFLIQSIKVKSEREVAQSCLTLSDPMDYSPSGSSIHGIFQARVLEWGAIPFPKWQTGNTKIYC